MPLYEYQCECNNETELLLSFQEAEQPQLCKCGKVMWRKMSVCSFVMNQDGNQRALDFLNSPEGEFPNAPTPQHKKEFQQGVFAGTQKPPRKYY